MCSVQLGGLCDQTRASEEGGKCDIKEDMWTQVTAFKAITGTSASTLGHLGDLRKGAISSDLGSLKKKTGSKYP